VTSRALSFGPGRSKEDENGPVVEAQAPVEKQTAIAVGRGHLALLIDRETGEDERTPRLEPGHKLRRKLDQRPGQDIGEDQIKTPIGPGCASSRQRKSRFHQI
jgi:hypothetical protein